jgi:16S rRNA (cytosine967-C5)-methyltransferase
LWRCCSIAQWSGGALKPEDRRFLQELVYGAVRWELTLDWLIAHKTGGKPQKALVQNLLRLGLYQMFWLDRVPSYAAVNETVEIAKRKGLLPQAKFINAVLRGYSREGDAIRAKLAEFKTTNLTLGFSHPECSAPNGKGAGARKKRFNSSNGTTASPGPSHA